MIYYRFIVVLTVVCGALAVANLAIYNVSLGVALVGCTLGLTANLRLDRRS